MENPYSEFEYFRNPDPVGVVTALAGGMTGAGDSVAGLEI
jgi:hypothetical protein